MLDQASLLLSRLVVAYIPLLLSVADHFGSQIRLAGLLGTYQQGLTYIQQQQASGGSSSSMSRSTSFHASSTSEVAMINLAASGAATAATAAATSAAAGEQRSGISSSRTLAPAGAEEDQPDHSSTSSVTQDSAEDDSSLEQDSSDNKTVSGGSTLSTDDVTVLLTDLDLNSCSGGSSSAGCATAGHQSGDCGHGMAGSTGSSSSGPGKLIMWLGSSIGNYNREEAAAFLTQLRELAMLPGRSHWRAELEAQVPTISAIHHI